MTLQIIFDYFMPRHKLENLSPNLTLSCPAIIYYLGVFFPPNSSSPTTLSFSLLPHPPPVSSIILIYCLFFTIDTMFLSFSLVSCFLLSLNSLLHCNTVFHFRQKKWKTQQISIRMDELTVPTLSMEVNFHLNLLFSKLQVFS